MEIKQYKKVAFDNIPLDNKELLMAELSVMTDLGIEDVNMSAINAYFESEDFSEEDIQTMSEKYQTTYEISSFVEENWNAQWEASITPIQVGDFCMIRAAFHPEADGVKHDIIITPKMSFGTGHHATTFHMIERMETLAFDNKSVLDFGTGTGVLGILAYKMGAKDIVAIDNDSWSIENAQECAEENGVEWTLLQGSLEVAPKKEYDIILANINLHILKAYADGLYEQLIVDGDLLISGILETDIEELMECFENEGFKHQYTSVKDKWVMMHWKK